jgi:phosphoglycolate phosphatase/pyrophosphatase PpaX
MNKFKAVIFDLDGTIGNTLPLCVRAFKEALEPLTGRKFSDEDIMATFGPSEGGTVRALAPEHYEEGLADYLHHYNALHDICPRPFDGMVELLDILKKNGVRLAMVTGKGDKSTAISLEKFGLDSYFELVETGIPERPIKKENIRKILKNFGNPALEEVLYVGDSSSDIDASKEVGVKVAAAAWAETAEPENLRSYQPDELFTSISGFSSWLQTRI